ncbi:MAG: hypothetical protein VX707_01530 [Chloroflexota bacterium]|nr:hypothetical protein [Chloroflexota bacterium]
MVIYRLLNYQDAGDALRRADVLVIIILAYLWVSLRNRISE